MSDIKVVDNPLYWVWAGMKQRCYNKNCVPYKRYGGRGIKVCDRWLKSPDAFYHDMFPSYSKGLQLERINNNGNYEPKTVNGQTQKSKQTIEEATQYSFTKGYQRPWLSGAML